jgi:hypothetical protein
VRLLSKKVKGRDAMVGTRKRLVVLTLAASVVAAGIATGVYASTRGASGGGVAAGTQGPNASISISNCKASKSDYITNDATGLGTSSAVYVPVPGMTKSVTTAKTGCVLVDVSAFGFAPSGNVEFVTVMLDGSQGSPTETQFAAADGTLAFAHASLFGFANVPAGTHSVAMMFRSNTGATVFVHRPAMQIDHL